MKKIISILAVMLTLASTAVYAQKKDSPKGERARAEQVAFITAELELTEAEAQAFWPVYNQVQAQRREAFENSRESMKALRRAVKDGADDKTMEKLLEDYTKAKTAADKVDADAISSYKKVLSMDKVAKLVIAQEKFRHNQVKKQGGPEETPRKPKPRN